MLSSSIAISDDPVPSKKLNRAVRVVGDSYSICKEILAFRRLTSAFYVYTPNLNPDALEKELYSY